MKRARSLGLAVLALALPLMLSQCSQKGNYPVSGIKPEKAAALQAAHDPWEPRKPSRAATQVIPPDRLEALGDLSLESRDYETSLLHYLQILKGQPDNYKLRYKVGVIFLLTGHWEGAQQELARVLVAHPEMLEAHEALGLVHLEEKQYSQAVEEFRQVLAQEPTRARTRYLLGVTQMAAGRPRDAIGPLETAAALDPKSAATFCALGQAYLDLKDYNKAVTWLKKGQVVAPYHQKINQQLGMALASLKQYPEALEAFLKNGDEAQAYNNIGVYYFMEARYEDAAKCFQRALELRPIFYQEAKINLHRALEKLQQGRQKDGESS
jgi:tetratricopeptide (TPR) repeat protein